MQVSIVRRIRPTYELFGIGTAGDAHHHTVTATSISSREIRYRSKPYIVHRNSTSVVSAARSL
jgi:hypothetical protein